MITLVDETEREQLSPPWYTYANMLKAVFEKDELVEVSDLEKNEDENGEYTITLTCKTERKCEALKKVLKTSVNFGKVTVVVNLTVEDDAVISEKAQIFDDAFTGNPLYHGVVAVKTPWGVDDNYAVFDKGVIQFYNDDLSDLYNNYTAVVADVVKEITKGRKETDVRISTDVE